MVKKNYDDMLSRFHLIPERNGRTDRRADRQTDRRTDLVCQYRASVCWRAIKMKPTSYDTHYASRPSWLRLLKSTHMQPCPILSGVSPIFFANGYCWRCLIIVYCRCWQWDWQTAGCGSKDVLKSITTVSGEQSATIRLMTLMLQLLARALAPG